MTSVIESSTINIKYFTKALLQAKQPKIAERNNLKDGECYPISYSISTDQGDVLVTVAMNAVGDRVNFSLTQAEFDALPVKNIARPW